MLSRSFWSFRSHAISNSKICSYYLIEFYLVRISKRSLVSTSGLRFRTLIFGCNIFTQAPLYSCQNTTISHYRHVSVDLDFRSKEPTIEKQMANALAFSDFEFLVTLMDSSLSSSSPISGNMLYSVLSHLASFGYYDEIERWTPLILQRDSRVSYKEKSYGTIGIRKLYKLRAYAAFYSGHLKDHMDLCISEYLSAGPLSSTATDGTSVRASVLTRIHLEDALVILFSLLHSGAGSEIELLCKTRRKQMKIQDFVELGLLEWRALVLIGKFYNAENCIRFLIHRCYKELVYTADSVVSPIRRAPAAESNGADLKASLPVTEQRPASARATSYAVPMDLNELRMAKVGFVLQHAGRSSSVGSFSSHLSRSLNSLIVHDVHLFQSAERVGMPSGSGAMAADPVAELLPRVNERLVLKHILNRKRIFAKSAQFDQILVLAARKLLTICVNECDWCGLRGVLVDLRGRLRQMVPLLDPVELSNLQARVGAHAPPVSGSPATTCASAQRASSESSSAARARGMRSGADAIEDAEVRAKRYASTALASRADVSVNAEDEDYLIDCIKLLSAILKEINDSLHPSNSFSSSRRNFTS